MQQTNGHCRVYVMFDQAQPAISNNEESIYNKAKCVELYVKKTKPTN